LQNILPVNVNKFITKEVSMGARTGRHGSSPDVDKFSMRVLSRHQSVAALQPVVYRQQDRGHGPGSLPAALSSKQVGPLSILRIPAALAAADTLPPRKGGMVYNLHYKDRRLVAAG
jgi:hypothetical protein